MFIIFEINKAFFNLSNFLKVIILIINFISLNKPIIKAFKLVLKDISLEIKVTSN